MGCDSWMDAHVASVLRSIYWESEPEIPNQNQWFLNDFRLLGLLLLQRIGWILLNLLL